jgi:hypothetical protein
MENHRQKKTLRIKISKVGTLPAKAEPMPNNRKNKIKYDWHDNRA